MAKSRKRSGGKPPGPPDGGAAGVPPREVGRPLRSRLIAVERRIGLFSQEDIYGTESRFAHPVMLPHNAPVPATLAGIFPEELSALERMGRQTSQCFRFDLPTCQVYCYPFFTYDGFQALVCLERGGELIAAWKEQEVLQPDTPRQVFSAKSERDIGGILDEALAGD